MASGTAPNTSLVLTEIELAFIERRYRGNKSQAIHNGLAAIMPNKTDSGLYVKERALKVFPVVASLDAIDLDDLADAIHIRRIELMAKELRSRGFAVRTEFRAVGNEPPWKLNYLLIDNPGDGPNEYATLEEARRLLDTVTNLPPAEAFKRWAERIEPWDQGRPYTRAEAFQDMRRERAELRQKYDAGEIDGEMFKIMWSQAGDYLTLANETK